ncbi:MAG: sulfite exporter TauE/SafE family protein [Rhizobiales bacterium]|nr:sulfite exporter TauE/SafE family protein [Hyphomicrobiales bacterium]
MTVISDPLFYALAIPAVVALGLSKGGFAGIGQMATPMLALVMPPLEAAAILLPIMLVQDSAALWVYRKEWSGRIFLIVLPGALVGIGLAWLFAAYVSDAVVRILIGVTTIGFVTFSWLAPTPAPRPSNKPAIASGVVSGVFSGFTSTLCQAGGPPFHIYVLSQKLTKMNFVGTTAYFFAAVNLLKVVPYFALGQFSTTGMGTSVALLPLAIATNLLGFWVVRITPQEVFHKITMVLMFLISIELIRAGAVGIWRG